MIATVSPSSFDRVFRFFSLAEPPDVCQPSAKLFSAFLARKRKHMCYWSRSGLGMKISHHFSRGEAGRSGTGSFGSFSSFS